MCVWLLLLCLMQLNLLTTSRQFFYVFQVLCYGLIVWCECRLLSVMYWYKVKVMMMKTKENLFYWHFLLFAAHISWSYFLMVRLIIMCGGDSCLATAMLKYCPVVFMSCLSIRKWWWWWWLKNAIICWFMFTVHMIHVDAWLNCMMMSDPILSNDTNITISKLLLFPNCNVSSDHDQNNLSVDSIACYKWSVWICLLWYLMLVSDMSRKDCVTMSPSYLI